LWLIYTQYRADGEITVTNCSRNFDTPQTLLNTNIIAKILILYFINVVPAGWNAENIAV